jgi:tetratricopeptide (TPR) repeat protein
MYIHEVIQSLKRAGPANVLWGPGCSPADSSFNWAHICLADLMRSGLVARVFAPVINRALLGALAADRQVPAVYHHPLPDLSDSAIPALFQVGDVEAAEIIGLIARGAHTGPWIVLGFDGNKNLANLVATVPVFERGLYWVAYTPPARTLPPGAHCVTGFDPDSFLAYLVRGLADFPPPSVHALAARLADPAATLLAWQRSAFESRRQAVRNATQKRVVELVNRAALAHGAEYRDLLAEALHEHELALRFTELHNTMAFAPWKRLAVKRRPSEARQVLERMRQWFDTLSEDADPAQRAFILSDLNTVLARFCTGPAADALFAEAERAIASIPRTVYVYGPWATLLATWATQESGPEADVIFERAREHFRRAIELHRPLNTDRHALYVFWLLRRAAMLPRAQAAEMLADARGHADHITKDKPNDYWGWRMLGLTALASGDAAEAARCLDRVLELRPAEASEMLSTWALGLGKLGRYADAYYRFGGAEKAAPASGDVHARWARVLLLAGDLDASDRRAAHANSLEPGIGSYHRACIAALRGDRDAVRQHLDNSAEYGHIPAYSEILREEPLGPVALAPWFRDLLAGMFA